MSFSNIYHLHWMHSKYRSSQHIGKQVTDAAGTSDVSGKNTCEDLMHVNAATFKGFSKSLNYKHVTLQPF